MRPFKSTLFITLVLFLLIVPYQSINAQNNETSNVNGNILTIEKSFNNSTIDGYNIFVPNSYKPNSKLFPLIIFLQGGLGVGGNVNSIFNWALPKLLLENKDKPLNEVLKKFIYVMPHLSTGQFYNNEMAIRAIINEISKEYNIDSNQIYLTGLSRGGHGTWGLASRMPDTFAAIAPICGAPHGITNYNALATLPIWTSHNIDDSVVSYNGTQRTIKKIEQLSNNVFFKTDAFSKVDYKKFDYIFISSQSDSHDAWTEFYNNKNLYKWFLRFKKEH